MQIFELHFNPPKQSELASGQAKLIFDTFCYEPENIYEKRLGSLYMVGELKNALPQNAHFLDNLAQVIKKNFYALSAQPAEKSFKKSLQKANEFLEEEVKKNNTQWMGNLNFSLISLKNLNLNFTKVGDIKIILLRGGKIMDLGRDLEIEGIEPYPLKIFLNIVSGKLATDDIIFISTKEVFSAFTKVKKPIPRKEKEKREIFPPDSLLGEIAQLIPFEEKKFKKILKEKDKILSEISGACLLIVIKPKVLPKLALSFEKEAPLFPIKEILKPLVKRINSLKSNFKIILKREITKTKIKVPLPQKKIPLPKISWSLSEKLTNLLKIKSSKEFKKKIILISVLIFLLVFGFFIFKGKKEAPFKKLPKTLSGIQDKINMAENFLILKEDEKANSMFQEAWKEILPLTETENPLKNEAQALKESIEKELYELNKIEKIEEPEILFEFRKNEFSPQKIVLLDKVLYFFNPYSKGLYNFEKGKKTKIETEKEFKGAFPFSKSSILFFSEPNQLVFWQENRFGKSIFLKLPFPDFKYKDLFVFSRSIYFLDSKRGEIIKYSSPLVINKDFPQRWLAPETERIPGAKSMAIDGSVWVLNQKNNIDRFYLGKLKETFVLDFFPTPEKIEKIFTNKNLPYIFLLEPGKKRIIILGKDGKVKKQFWSEKFDNLKDFAVSNDGTIYLLNGQKIYKIKFK